MDIFALFHGLHPHVTATPLRIPGPFLQETTGAGHIQPRWYQVARLPQELTHPLPGVIIATTHRQPQARVHVLLCSRDLDLADAPLVDS